MTGMLITDKIITKCTSACCTVSVQCSHTYHLKLGEGLHCIDSVVLLHANLSTRGAKRRAAGRSREGERGGWQGGAERGREDRGGGGVGDGERGGGYRSREHLATSPGHVSP